MRTMNGDTYSELYAGKKLTKRPERVLQFGEGGFLRAFVDQMIHAANERGKMDAGVVVVQPIARGLCEALQSQDCVYTLMLRGKEKGKVVNEVSHITAISRTLNPYEDFKGFLTLAKNPHLRFIVSNTTEAGIVYTGQDHYDDAPPASFPGKLTRFLHERYLWFGKEKGKGFILLPCELIDQNGACLRECVLQTARQWNLSDSFIEWVERENAFCSTLVDRIVTGYPRDEAQGIFEELGYEDPMLDVAEPFGLWVIEGPKDIAEELPLVSAGQNVIFTDDVTPYKLRKVRMLNGAHTSMVLGAYLAGKDTVGECMADPAIRDYMTRALYEEIMPTLDLPKAELEAFAKAIFERFENPFNKHYLLSIALNSVSKFRARVLPTIKEYVVRKHALPPILTFSLAALIAFYQGSHTMQGTMAGTRGEDIYPIVDDQAVLDFFLEHSGEGAIPLTNAVLSNTALWGEDLTKIDCFAAAVAEQVRLIQAMGAKRAIESLV